MIATIINEKTSKVIISMQQDDQSIAWTVIFKSRKIIIQH